MLQSIISDSPPDARVQEKRYVNAISDVSGSIRQVYYILNLLGTISRQFMKSPVFTVKIKIVFSLLFSLLFSLNNIYISSESIYFCKKMFPQNTMSERLLSSFDVKSSAHYVI